jgi:replication-associated recombination protein RarA
MLPSTYRPKVLADFIGPAGKWAAHLEKLVRLALPNGDPFRILLIGPPGVGKTQLAELLVRMTGAGKFNVSKFNGTSFRIDDCTEMQRSFRLRDMFNAYRVLQIEEVDKVPTVAQVALLTLLDDLPDHTACIATTNKSVKEFEIRFQRRFTVCEIGPPDDGEIERFIRQHWPIIPPRRVKEIATFATGNVGQALTDADNAFAEYAA